MTDSFLRLSASSESVTDSCLRLSAFSDLLAGSFLLLSATSEPLTGSFLSDKTLTDTETVASWPMQTKLTKIEPDGLTNGSLADVIRALEYSESTETHLRETWPSESAKGVQPKSIPIGVRSSWRPPRRLFLKTRRPGFLSSL